jgi:hypothetical protein
LSKPDAVFDPRRFSSEYRREVLKPQASALHLTMTELPRLAGGSFSLKRRLTTKATVQPKVWFITGVGRGSNRHLLAAAIPASEIDSSVPQPSKRKP